MESTAHLFLHCDFIVQVWNSLPLREHVDPMSCDDLVGALKLGKKTTCLPPVGVISNIVLWVLWGLWIARNYLIFEGRHFTPEDVISKSIWSAREWNMAQPRIPPSTKHRSKSLIIPDLDDTILCFSDAAWRKEDNTAGFGCIFMDKQGHTLHQGMHTERNVSSPPYRWSISAPLDHLHSQF